jgi:hypothetical protein
MSSLPIPRNASAISHAWWPRQDMANQTTVWRCTCGEKVFQPFGEPVPCELISHPQSFGQMRGEVEGSR